MRVAVVGAGLAGLASAAGLSRAGHSVEVFERSDALRASGLALNFWSNATSLLPGLGVADGLGEPVARMTIRAQGRDVTTMSLPAKGLPHVNVDRAPLLEALARALPEGAVSYGVSCTDAAELAGAYDLVVVADGVNSKLRNYVSEQPRKRWLWPIWQACVPAEAPEVPPGTGAAIVRAGMFAGIWRLPGGRLGWFVEQPSRTPGTGHQLLEELRGDKDPLLRAAAAATRPEDLVEWLAQDTWPGRRLYRSNVVLVGDAAHAMLPTLGQGACQSLEDAAELTRCIETESSIAAALRLYQRRRLLRVKIIVGLARAGAVTRRSNLMSRAIPESVMARLLGISSGPIMRHLTKPNPRLVSRAT
ncbi:MAG TPA: FAD-dependent monooxygenase [Mycobacteriales bacterium]|nr:FAD-dependent monooxygenase [Mycobacteriales bacterium]